jgi:hypothetical protein
MPTSSNEGRASDDATRATAHLPGLDIEIVHRRSATGDAEQISITMQAVPSFAAFGRYVEDLDPFALWMQALQMAWAPWLQMASVLALPPVPARQVTTTQPTEQRPTA